MIDPLAEVVTLLQPSTRYSKLVHGASPWRISRTVAGEPFYCAVRMAGAASRSTDIRRSSCCPAISC